MAKNKCEDCGRKFDDIPYEKICESCREGRINANFDLVALDNLRREEHSKEEQISPDLFQHEERN